MGLLSSNYSISGEVLYRGENLLHCSKKRLQAIYGKEICYIMQNPMTAFNPSLRIGRQLEKTCYLHNPQNIAAGITTISEQHTTTVGP